ncbi:MAG: AbgT family transporter [Bacteroidetes bacterium]|nr:AbgT family transporter [Bacteroidota bacterium]MBU1579892.1 AbgT family transporter [Bacteroidota bacterium]MBU2557770.1 AbgT family transporter [Bacteroidota bacterium]
MTKTEAKGKKKLFDRFLHFVEVGGNALPHPASIFAMLAIAVLVISWIGHFFDWAVVHPVTDEEISIINLLSKEGVHRIFLEMVDNYTGFAPLGIVMVALLGIGIAESSGLIGAAIRLLVIKAPSRLLTFVIVLAGIISNMASDLGYVLIIPMAGIIFHAVGRHPIAGMAAAFAGVSGGFSANIFIGTIDPLLAGLSTESARILDPEYYVLPTANYYFMAVSTFLIAFLGTWITNKIVEPRLGKYTGDVKPEPINPLTARERKALRYTVYVALAWGVLIAATLIPDQGFFRSADNSILHSPLLKGFIALLFFAAGSLGIVYGGITGRFKSDADVVKGMVESFKTLAAFMVLVFFAAQFVAYFKWSNLGLFVAIEGAHFLQSVQMGTVPLLILFILLSGFINMFMGSASAKWAILGPVFIPMFMILGFSPELSQAVFRVGDSITNIISPMMSFFALIIVYFEKYDKKAGIGTLISTMIPYSMLFFVFWTILLIAWVLLNIPLGPGAPIHYPG